MFLIFYPMKLRIGTRGNNGVPNFKYYVDNVIQVGFCTKIVYLCCFYAFLFVRTLNEKVTMATRKDLSIFCKFQILANTYLRKVNKFQGYGFCRFGVQRH